MAISRRISIFAMFFDQGTIFILTCWGVDKPANQKIGYQFPLLHSPNMLCKDYVPWSE
nr:MAG TPA: hypothetical protein [Caudoviricetes sp.]